ncbi:MAG: response regulator transcription factor [Dehalococcoidia bacterium]|nr:response regulator transcription factor [Dehalococcoidia bacterium]MDW8119355.1 response regulator transcription factor [Chloroflexota bacterium]
MQSPKPYRILVVEDDARLCRFLADLLRRQDYQVESATDGLQALQQAEVFQPHLVLLDLLLPNLNGLEVLHRLRQWSNAVVLVLSGRGEEALKVRALDLGADDYLTKPFSPPELLARVRALLRRAEHSPSLTTPHPVLTFGDLTIDLSARIVKRSGQEVPLTRTEFALLQVLVANAGKVLTHKELLQQVWGPEYGQETEYLRTFIKQLRRKLEPDPARPRYIVTQAGVGYRFQPPGNAESR